MLRRPRCQPGTGRCCKCHAPAPAPRAAMDGSSRGQGCARHGRVAWAPGVSGSIGHGASVDGVDGVASPMSCAPRRLCAVRQPAGASFGTAVPCRRRACDGQLRHPSPIIVRPATASASASVCVCLCLCVCSPGAVASPGDCGAGQWRCSTVVSSSRCPNSLSPPSPISPPFPADPDGRQRAFLRPTHATLLSVLGLRLASASKRNPAHGELASFSHRLRPLGQSTHRWKTSTRALSRPRARPGHRRRSRPCEAPLAPIVLPRVHAYPGAILRPAARALITSLAPHEVPGVLAPWCPDVLVSWRPSLLAS